jgi:hypothetical protein
MCAAEVLMKSVVLSLPAFAFVVGTRAALAAGVALLLADKLPTARRRAIGAALAAIGAATTVPAAISPYTVGVQISGESNLKSQVTRLESARISILET